MKIVAIDAATVNRIAVGDTDGNVKFWSHQLGKKGASQEARFAASMHMVNGLIKSHSPDLVVIEAAIGGHNANAFLIGLVACIRGVCYARNIRCEVVTSQSVRRYFLGYTPRRSNFPNLSAVDARKAIKQVVIDRCKAVGWHPKDDNQADALAMFDYACAKFGRSFVTSVPGGMV